MKAYTEVEAAASLGVPRSSFRKAIERGMPGVIRNKSKKTYDIDVISEWWFGTYKKPREDKGVKGTELARIAQCSRVNVGYWCKMGLPYNKYDNGSTIFDLEEVIAWLQSRGTPDLTKRADLIKEYLDKNK